MSLIDQAGCVGTSILFDLGFHQGEGLAWLTDHYSIDSSWIVFAFEPNSKCAPYLKQAHLRSHACFIPLPFAVDAKAGQAVFQREVCWRSGAETGEGSHLQDLALIGDFTAAGEELIWRINFPQFLRAIIPVKDKPFVVVKMDIEGAEYSILRALLADNSIELIDVLHVEFHDRLMDSETESTTAQLTEALSGRVKLVQHW